MLAAVTARTRVLIVDDHQVFSEALARSLAEEPDLRIVGTASRSAEALEIAIDHSPDVAIVDHRLSDGDGVVLARALRERVPDISVVMLTAAADDGVLAAALDAGCVGFVTKDQPLAEVLIAVRAAAAGEAVIAPAMLTRLIDRMRGTGARRVGRNPELTSREHEILQLVAAGLPNPQIAARLHVSLHTVRNHVAAILRKLEAHTKLEAVAIAARRGLIAGRDGG
jgi:DNA-binding NarL/FixJ family response regulator